ncbi:MAG: GNAT family N-acetyltransferase [Candidatus Zixiibacteriota bacterium]
MPISYTDSIVPPVETVAALFDNSGLKRPTGDLPRIQRMLDEGDLFVTAWDGDHLVGFARSLTDFCYCCYLSDLAVAKDFQRKGIGKELIRLTKEKLGDQVMILLLAALTAEGYYEHIGFEYVKNGWIIPRKS